MSNTVSFENEVLEACATSRDGKPAFFSEAHGRRCIRVWGLDDAHSASVARRAIRTECTLCEHDVSDGDRPSRRSRPVDLLLVMEASAEAPTPIVGMRRTRRVLDRFGDGALRVVTGLAALGVLLIIAGIIWKVIDGARLAISTFGISFVWNSTWNPVTEVFGAREFIIGTLVTSFGALLFAAPLSIAIGLFLSELAPPSVRGVIGSLIQMLAAVPSVVIGLWGIFVLGPFMRAHVEPFLATPSAGFRSSRAPLSRRACFRQLSS